MGATTKIPWTERTFNPWWGCEPVSPGCANCYARAFDRRLGGNHWGRDAPRRLFEDAYWEQPRRWERIAARRGVRSTVFAGSMCDVFEDRVVIRSPRQRLWEIIEETPHLDWLLLTKRPENVPGMVPPRWMANDYDVPLWPNNVWFGVTVENQEQAARRIPLAFCVPAPVIFLSMEPLLEFVTLGAWLPTPRCRDCGHPDDAHAEYGRTVGCQAGKGTDAEPICGCRKLRGEALHMRGMIRAPHRIGWVIVGAESGPRARPMDEDWVRCVRNQCAGAKVPFLYKQRVVDGKAEHLPLLDGVQHEAYPEGEA